MEANVRFWPALSICGLYLLLIVLSGCETFKGAADGFYRDWQNAKKVDDWMREHLW
ncbi:MAG: hypothetical protein PVI33_00745 [Candidatus Omnitrophota bacterium]